MKRSNDKQLKVEHELCERVGLLWLHQFRLIAMDLIATFNITENYYSLLVTYVRSLESWQVIKHLQDGKDIRLGDWKAADIEILNTFQLLSAKPVVYLVCVLVHLHTQYILSNVRKSFLSMTSKCPWFQTVFRKNANNYSILFFLCTPF
jgi:obg-like ATPase 1